MDQYTLYELYYEYRDLIARKEATVKAAERQDDIIEDKKLDEVLDWAAQEEAKEKEQAEKAAEDAKLAKWMAEELEKNKAELGEDFGDDLSLSFDE